jgi:hypothetical protein
MIKLVPTKTNFHKYLESRRKTDNDDDMSIVFSLFS